MQYYLNDYIYCIVHGIPFHYPSWFRCINITTALLSLIKCSCHFFIYCFSHKSSKARLRQLGFIGGKKISLGRQNTNKSGRSENVTNSTDLEDSTDLNSSNPNENSKWNVLRHFVRDGSIQSRLDAAASTQLWMMYEKMAASMHEVASNITQNCKTFGFLWSQKNPTP